MDVLVEGMSDGEHKDWVKENSSKIQETFNNTQERINEFNVLVEDYNAISRDLPQVSVINSIPEIFTSENIRSTHELFTNQSFLEAYSDRLGHVSKIQENAKLLKANLDTGVFSGITPENVSATIEILEKISGKMTGFKNSVDKINSLKKEYEEQLAKEKSRADRDKEAAKTAQRYGAGATVQPALDEANRRLAALEKDRAEGLGSFVPTENALGTVFQEQCFLQAKIIDIAKYRKEHFNTTKHKRLPYVSSEDNVSTNASLLVEGQPFGFVNKLTQPRSYGAMFDMHSEVLSQLLPMVRLYKVEMKGGKEYEVPITFDTHDSTSRIVDSLKNKSTRGLGVGLKSFDFTYDGSDPFSLKKSIKATLTIHATSFDELLRDRTAMVQVDNRTKKFNYTYADLALKTGSDLSEQKINSDPNKKDIIIDNLSKLKFRLKACVGYQIPQNLTIGGKRGKKATIESAVNDSFVTLNLTPTIHEFDFDESGRVQFKINYLAYIEDFFDDAYFNIFSIPQFIASKDVKAPSIYGRKLQLKKLESDCEFDKIKELNEDKEYEKNKHIEAMQSLLKPLFEKNLIKYIDLTYKDLLSFHKQGASFNLKKFNVNSLDQDGNIVTEEEVKKAVENGANEEETDPAFGNRETGGEQYRQISFFYFSDLVDTILENMELSLSNSYNNEIDFLLKNGVIDKTLADSEKTRVKKSYLNFKRMRIMLGPIELNDAASPGHTAYSSIGDIPISVKYFIEYMTSKLLSKNYFSYSLSTFMNDFIKNYLRNFLNSDECFNGSQRQKISFFNSSITSYAKGNKTFGNDEVTQLIRVGNTGQRLNMEQVGTANTPILNVMGSRTSPSPSLGQDNELNYMIFYAGRSQPKDLMTGNMALDRKNGIQHYILGRDRGIVKNITLTKTTSTGLKELRFEQEGYDGFTQLREVYDVSIDSFLSPNTFPGTYIYVEPRGFAPNSKSLTNGSKYDRFELTKYGIGGYYMITKTEHSITSDGVRQTNIIAKWVAQLDKERNVEDNRRRAAEIESNPDLSRVQKCKLKKQIDSTNNDQSAPRDTVGLGG